MDKKSKFKILKISILCALAPMLIFSYSEIASAAQPPVPPQRPKVLHVSPEYIKKLMEERNIKVQAIDTKTVETTEISVPPATPELEEKHVDQNTAIPVDNKNLDETTIQNTTKQEVLDILDGKKNSIPRPADKPEQTPAAEPERTLISFSLKPSVVTMDDNIVNFLKEHALKLFNENKDMTMEINAYATALPNETHSAIRISLARSLEVRKWLMDNNISPSRLKLNHSRDDKDIQADDRIDLILVQ